MGFDRRPLSADQWMESCDDSGATGSDDGLLYESIELNGTTYAIKTTFSPGVCSSNWWGMTVNYQMDGNVSQRCYLDNLTLIDY